MKKLSLALLFLVLTNTSLGFGAKAHRVIAEIADKHITESTKAAVSVLLEGESLASVSTWADEMRYSNEGSSFWSYDYSSNWHFINVDKSNHYYQSSKNNRGDAYLALNAFVAILKEEELTDSIILEGLTKSKNEGSTKGYSEKQIALRFLVHLVADIHQPLHLGYEEDRGGNNIKVAWYSRQTNLHSVWDSRLIEAQNLSVTELEQKLMSALSQMSQVTINGLAEGDLMTWIDEGLDMRERIYTIDHFKGYLGDAYLDEFTPLVEAQMLKAGLRLAILLNSIFSAN